MAPWAWFAASTRDWPDVPGWKVTSRLPTAAAFPSGATTAGRPPSVVCSSVWRGAPVGEAVAGVGAPAIIGAMSVEPWTLWDEGAPGFGWTLDEGTPS